MNNEPPFKVGEIVYPRKGWYGKRFLPYKAYTVKNCYLHKIWNKYAIEINEVSAAVKNKTWLASNFCFFVDQNHEFIHVLKSNERLLEL